MAEAQLALSQLMQLRDAWRSGWVPLDRHHGLAIQLDYTTEDWFLSMHSLRFKNRETRDLFQETFEVLINKITPLYFS